MCFSQNYFRSNRNNSFIFPASVSIKLSVTQGGNCSHTYTRIVLNCYPWPIGYRLPLSYHTLPYIIMSAPYLSGRLNRRWNWRKTWKRETKMQSLLRLISLSSNQVREYTLGLPNVVALSLDLTTAAQCLTMRSKLYQAKMLPFLLSFELCIFQRWFYSPHSSIDIAESKERATKDLKPSRAVIVQGISRQFLTDNRTVELGLAYLLRRRDMSPVVNKSDSWTRFWPNREET